jgi:D-alanyl-D-alanine carboxypeptidase
MPSVTTTPRVARRRHVQRRVQLARLAVLSAVAVLTFGIGFNRGSELTAAPRASSVVAPVAAVAGESPAAPAGIPGVSPIYATTTALPSAALQARLAELRKRYTMPGVSVTIIWPDGRSWSGVSGWANLKTRMPVYGGTAFAIGSVTKTFMAALILDLAEERRLSLNDRVRRWLPTARVSSSVTIRQLLDHTSGVYDFFSNPTIDAALLADKRRVWTSSRALSYVRSPYFAAGKGWHYSNSNYVLLGQIVRRVTGRTVAAELRRRFVNPLGLSRTFMQGVETRRSTVATAYVQRGWGTSLRQVSQSDGTSIAPFTSVTTAAGNAGAIAASSRDLAVWARALYGGAVLEPTSLTAMEDVSHSVSVGATRRYGLGLMEEWFGGRRTYGHTGRLIGSRSSIRYLPDYGFTIAVVTNQDRYSSDSIGTPLMDIAIASVTPVPPPSPILSPSATAAPSSTPVPSAPVSSASLSPEPTPSAEQSPESSPESSPAG